MSEELRVTFEEALIDLMGQEMPRDIPDFLRVQMTKREKAIMTFLQTTDLRVTIENMPLSDLYTGCNAMLKLMAQLPDDSPQFHILDQAQAGITATLEEYFPGTGEALNTLYEFYVWTSVEAGK